MAYMDGSASSDVSAEAMEPMVDFWGVELTAKQKKVQWPKSEDDLDPDVVMRLELRQACLGAKAKDGERNVVAITAEDENGEDVTHTILSLRVGGTEQSPLFMEVFPPVTFSLVSGTGPLHIVGTVHTECDEMYSSDEEEEEEEDVEESLTSPDVKKARKRPAASPPSKPTKALKLGDGQTPGGDKQLQDQEDEKSDESEEEEEDEEEEEEETSEEEESSEEDEEEEEEEKTAKKTPSKPAWVSKGKSTSAQKPPRPEKSKVQFKTPQPMKSQKITAKATLSAPTTPEQSKGPKKSAKTPMGMEEMKEKLRKTPNLPKKLDKFNNYVQHNFKVTDDRVKKQLWEFVQKTRGSK